MHLGRNFDHIHKLVGFWSLFVGDVEYEDQDEELHDCYIENDGKYCEKQEQFETWIVLENDMKNEKLSEAMTSVSDCEHLLAQNRPLGVSHDYASSSYALKESLKEQISGQLYQKLAFKIFTEYTGKIAFEGDFLRRFVNFFAKDHRITLTRKRDLTKEGGG